MRTNSNEELGDYCRKSTDTEDKQILSLPDQTRVNKEYAEFKKLPLSKKYHFEESKSAKIQLGQSSIKWLNFLGKEN